MILSLKEGGLTIASRDKLQTNTRLIIGLNPIFSSNATLTNKIINKASEFKLELVILIVPKERKGNNN